MSDRDPTEEWAFIFNTLGQETLRELLFDVAAELDHDDGHTRRIIEARADDGEIRALDITDHVSELEDQ